MLWIFNKKVLNDTIIFHQIFNNKKNYNDDNGNIIFDLNSSKLESMNSYNSIKLNYEIKIMGNIISYKNLDNNEILTFTKKENYINRDNNLILTHEYKLIDNQKLPELTSYDYHYSHLELNIYYKDYDKFFIIQNDKSNNSSINYWIQISI
jgi:hypothetical protein